MNRRQFKRNPCVRTASVAVLLTLAVASASVVQGATTVKAPLPIVTTYAATNAEQTQLTITGISFLGTATSQTVVTLGSSVTPLQIITKTNNSLTVLLPPGTSPGSYLMTVSTTNPAQFDEFYVTIGAMGPAGPKGDTGAQGIQGPIGLAGPTGPQGPKGDTGAVGPIGPAGPQGVAGAQGPAGPAGPSGRTGDTGLTGPAGATGATGPQGPAGNSISSLGNLSGIACNVGGTSGTLSVDVASNGLVTLTCAATSPPPPPVIPYEALDNSVGTVGRAIGYLFGGGTLDIPASCGTNPRVNCPGGVPTPTKIRIDNSSVSVAQSTTPTTYSFSVVAHVATVSDIAFDYSGIPCGLTFNTTSSGSPTATVSGTASFANDANSGLLSHLVFSGAATEGVEATDLLFSGGPLCSLGNSLGSFFASYIEAQIKQRTSLQLCGAPGQDEFMICQ